MRSSEKLLRKELATTQHPSNKYRKIGILKEIRKNGKKASSQYP